MIGSANGPAVGAYWRQDTKCEWKRKPGQSQNGLRTGLFNAPFTHSICSVSKNPLLYTHGLLVKAIGFRAGAMARVRGITSLT